MNACRNCQHRITECEDKPADATAEHLKTLIRLTGWARSNYLSNVSRAEGQAAADRLNAADLALSKGTV